MSRAVELLVKMAEPKCVSMEAISRGVASLHREQILAALAYAENNVTFGYHLLVAKYCRDIGSINFVRDYAKQWASRHEEQDTTEKCLNWVVDILLDIPLPFQEKKLRSLRNRYLSSKYAHLKALEKADSIARISNFKPNSPEARDCRIRELNVLRKSTICPRCRGVGEIGRVQKRQCPECEGKGRLNGTTEMIIRSLGDLPTKETLRLIITQFEQYCYVEMSNAERMIKERLELELE